METEAFQAYPPCEICGRPGVGVFSSVMGAISHAYCDDCRASNREVWTTLVGGLAGLDERHCSDWVIPIIKETCEFYGKTEKQLWIEVAQLETDFQEYMNTNPVTTEATDINPT